MQKHLLTEASDNNSHDTQTADTGKIFLANIPEKSGFPLKCNWLSRRKW